MATLSLSSREPATIEADALVVGVAATRSGPVLLDARLSPELHEAVSASLDGLGVTGATDEVLRIPSPQGVRAPVLVLTGVGRIAPDAQGHPARESLRRAAGAAVRTLAGRPSVALALPHQDDDDLTAVCEGALFGAYAFHRYRSGPADAGPDDRATGSPASSPRPAVRTITVATETAETPAHASIIGRSQVVADAVHATRDLVNTAPVDLYPASFASHAMAAVADLPVAVTVLDETHLAEEGFGGMLGVGLGSSRPPRLVRLDYAPDGADAHLALIGKGITFDSGGLSLKPAQGMDAMKSDMAGAAAVLHTVVATARLGIALRLTGWLVLAENMPSGTAQRPSDVITIHGGRTVEVLNTDAEGRLVLADALVAASNTSPDMIVDVATLTGAQLVALGARTSAIMSNEDELRERIHHLAQECGEQFWPMPLPEELRASMDSAVADIANMGERYGGMLVAGLFLKEFVGTHPDPRHEGEEVQIPWAHLDIAGPAFNTGSPHGYTPTGGTGVAVRTLLALVQDLA